MGTFFVRLKTKISGTARKLLSLRAAPHEIATGFAIGVFIGIFPTFGLGGLVILALSPLWKFNLPAAFLGTLIGNPLFAPLWITITCLVTGISLSAIKIPDEPFRHVLAHYSQIGLRYLAGNAALSLVVAIISYFCILGAIHWFKQRAKNRETKN